MSVKKVLLLSIAIVLGTTLFALDPALPEAYVQMNSFRNGGIEYINYENMADIPQQVPFTKAKIGVAIIPDFFGENLLISTQSNDKLYAVGDAHSLILLANGGSAVYLFVWDNPETEVMFKGGFAMMTLPAKSSGRVYEIVSPAIKTKDKNAKQIYAQAGKNIWAKVTTPINNQSWQECNWNIPFIGDFQVIYQKTNGISALDKNSYENWKILPNSKTVQPINQKMIITDGTNWSSFLPEYGDFIYPTKASVNRVRLRFPIAPALPNLTYNANAYIYPWSKESYPQYWQGMGLLEQPSDMIMPVEAIKDFLPSKIWNTIAPQSNPDRQSLTIPEAVTAVLKLYNSDNVQDSVKKIAELAVKMNNNYLTMNSRLETYRQWSALERVYLTQKAPKSIANRYMTYPNTFDSYYNSIKSQITSPEVFKVAITNLVAIASNENLDEQAKLEQATRLCEIILTTSNNQNGYIAKMATIIKCSRQQATLDFSTERDKKNNEALIAIRQLAAQALRYRLPQEGK